MLFCQRFHAADADAIISLRDADIMLMLMRCYYSICCAADADADDFFAAFSRRLPLMLMRALMRFIFMLLLRCRFRCAPLDDVADAYTLRCHCYDAADTLMLLITLFSR